MVKQAKTQQKKTPQRSTAASLAAPKPPTKPNLELFMECVDEDLTPSQLEANRKATTEYVAAVEQIKSVSRQPPVAPSLSIKRSSSPDVIVLDDDEQEVVPTAGLQYHDQVINTQAPAAQVYRAPVTAPRSIACAPVIPPPSSSSIVAPRMFFTFPSGAANRPILLPAGFAQVQIISPVAASFSQSSVTQNNFCNAATIPARLQPESIAPHPLQLIRPPVTSSVWSSVESIIPKIPHQVTSGQGGVRQQLAQSLVRTPKLTANVNLKTSESSKKVIPTAVSATNLDSVLESVARGFSGPSSKNKRGRPPKVLRQGGQEDNTDDPIITVDDTEDDSDSNWVPLDEYYYGRKDGDPSYREDKGIFKFKCWFCDKMLDNNIRVMSHIQGHIDNEKQLNLERANLTQCTHCDQQFGSPFEMQCHVDKVHQNQSRILMCHICEKDFKNEAMLRQHMKQTHSACEMPYVCQLCGFRSSVYNDVVDHFKKRHDCTANLLCLYCLKTVKSIFCSKIGFCPTARYYQHVCKHLDKNTVKKCHSCKLTFFNKMHSSQHVKDHAPNFRGVPSAKQSPNDSGFKLDTLVGRSSASELVMIPLPQVPKVKLLNAPKLSSQVDLSGLRLYGVETSPKCLECGKAMDTSGHYQRYLACTMCRFATVCGDAYLNHMARFHRGKSQVLVDGVLSDSRKRQNTKMHGPTYCMCGFSSYFGANIANHLVSCSKRTCYRNLPEQKWSEYDDEREEFNSTESHNKESDAQSPERDIPTLFGALGLVKKARRAGHTRHGKSTHVAEISPSKVASEIIDDILDIMFPAEAAASDIMSMLLDGVDKALQSREMKSTRKNRMVSTPVPSGCITELTGSRKWSTVKISDDVIPSVSSIFLGCENEEKMDVDPECSSATKAEDCEFKAGDSIVDPMSDDPAAVASCLVYEFKATSNGLSADRCLPIVSAEDPMIKSHILHNGNQMNKCLKVSTLNSNDSIECVTESFESNTFTSNSGFNGSKFESLTIDEELRATIVSKGLTDLNECNDDHAAHHQASKEFSGRVTSSADHLASNDVSVELADRVAHGDDLANSDDTPVDKPDRGNNFDDHAVTNDVDMRQPDVIETVDLAHVSEHQGSSNLVSKNEQGLDSIDLRAVDVESTTIECDSAIVLKKTLKVQDDIDSSDLLAKCGDDEFVTAISTDLNAQLLSCEERVSYNSVLELDASEFLDTDGVQENTVCGLNDELILLPATNTVNPRSLVREEFVENSEVLAGQVSNDAREFENTADTEAVGCFESVVSRELISLSKSIWTDKCRQQQSDKFVVPMPNLLPTPETISSSNETNNSVGHVYNDGNVSVSIDSQIETIRKGGSEEEKTESNGSNDHEIETINGAAVSDVGAGTNEATTSDVHYVISLKNVDAAEDQMIHQAPSTQHSDFGLSTQEIITGQISSLPATDSEQLYAGINVARAPSISSSQESLTTSKNLHEAASHPVVVQQKEELVINKTTVRDELKRGDLGRKPSESRQEERKDKHTNSSYDRRDFDRRNDQRGYHHSQQTWRGGYSQTGFNQQEYGRLNYAGRPEDRRGYLGQDANRQGNNYGSQNRGGRDNQYFQYGDDRRYGANRGGYRGGNYGGGYYDRR